MPFHNRRWRSDEVTPEELAEKLVTHSWCMCQGWLCEGVLWLNDAISPDGAQEWAVVRKSDGRQLESITVGWALPEDDKKNILEVQRKYRHGDGKPMWGPDYNLEDGALDHPEGSCYHCA